MPNDLIQFDAFAFTPADGLKNHEYSPTEPESESAIREQVQGISDQLRDHINAVQQKLNATDDGASGAHRIGASGIPGVTGQNVAQQLLSLKQLIDESAAGAIPDNTIETVKLKDGAVTSEKLAADAVTSEKLADGCVASAALANGCVTAEKLSQDLGEMRESVLLTASGTWTPPYDGIYTVTLMGGGGGGGSGFIVYDKTLNSNSNFPRTGVCGEGGSASIAVTKRLQLYQNETYQFVIGAGGAGRTGSNYTMKTAGKDTTTPPEFSDCDGFATAGGESAMYVGDKEIFSTSQRTKGAAFYCYVLAYLSRDKSKIASGGSGGGYFAGTRSITEISDDEITAAGNVLNIEPGPGLMGAGVGSTFNRTVNSQNQASPAGNATGYGCGGGGGCAPYVNRQTPPVNGKSFVNSGGNGGNGYALIEWYAPQEMA